MKRLTRRKGIAVVERLAVDPKTATVTYKVKPIREVRKGGNIIIRKVDNKKKV